MESNKCVALVLAMVAVMVVTHFGGSRALSLCNLTEDQLMICKPAVTEPNPVDPSAECCEALSGADLECLCSYKNSPELPLFGIDPDLATALPAKCNLTTPANC
ncbi:hypothetical protein L6164_003075 [Bauhinia variegata]|uniref:Uncharacterized protein n=1 Tax=Bauhinia variegata TaxID=167791 RepID=A0ACB9Q0B4_BAUVA|nr:hypothetical protein L6164_003075 [Bauhinia variegata]